MAVSLLLGLVWSWEGSRSSLYPQAHPEHWKGLAFWWVQLCSAAPPLLAWFCSYFILHKQVPGCSGSVGSCIPIQWVPHEHFTPKALPAFGPPLGGVRASLQHGYYQRCAGNRGGAATPHVDVLHVQPGQEASLVGAAPKYLRCNRCYFKHFLSLKSVVITERQRRQVGL